MVSYFFPQMWNDLGMKKIEKRIFCHYDLTSIKSAQRSRAVFSAACLSFIRWLNRDGAQCFGPHSSVYDLIPEKKLFLKKVFTTDTFFIYPLLHEYYVVSVRFCLYH